jgi:hypothetical protein
MFQKPLHFVQRGRILLRCGSALALSLPSLGVSSLDLGRLFTQAALFLETVTNLSESFRRRLERSEIVERNGGQRFGQDDEILRHL